MRILVAAFASFLGFCTTVQAADVINGCYQKQNGQLRILTGSRQRCRPSEVPIALGKGGETPGTGASVGDSPGMYDAAGQYLGIAQGESLYIPSLQKFALIELTYATGGIGPGVFSFESDDCTGEPYVRYDTYNWVFQLQGRHYTAGDRMPAGAALRSWLSSDNMQCIPDPNDPNLGVAFAKAIEVRLPFTVPVALPLRLVNPTR